MLQREILTLHSLAVLCPGRRSKYSKAKQEADEEKHLNQGKRPWGLGVLVWVVKHGSCSGAQEIRDCIRLEENTFLFSPPASKFIYS